MVERRKEKGRLSLPISLIKSLASSAGSPQTAGVGCRAAKMSNCRYNITQKSQT